MNAFDSVIYFLIATTFNLISLVLWSRLFIQYFSLNRLHQFSHGIYQLTNPIVKLTHTYVLRGYKLHPRYDLPCLLVLIICELLRFTILNFVFLQNLLPLLYLFLYVIIHMILQPCNILFYAIIIRAILSLVNPGWQNPIIYMLFAITEPMLKPIRTLIPPIAGIDFSIIFVLLGLKSIELFILRLLPYQLF